MCDIMKTDETPIKKLNDMITKADKKYIDASIDAFKYRLFEQLHLGK